jgi:hypothetical protein
MVTESNPLSANPDHGCRYAVSAHGVWFTFGQLFVNRGFQQACIILLPAARCDPVHSFANFTKLPNLGTHRGPVSTAPGILDKWIFRAAQLQSYRRSR